MKQPFTPRNLLPALCAGALVATPGVTLATEPDGTNDWQYAASIYLWGAGINGETARGSDVNVNFKTLIDNLNMAAMGAFEARKDKWSLLADVIYLNVGANQSGKVSVPVALDTSANVRLNASVKTKGWVLGLIGAYSVMQTPEANLDLLAGARYLDLQLDFGLDAGVGPYAASRDLSASGSVWDAVIGLKGYAEVNPKWYVPYYLDVGTGQSDLTWQASAGLAYRFNWGDVSLVYRYIKWDFGSDSAVDNISFSGPLLAATFRF